MPFRWGVQDLLAREEEIHNHPQSRTLKSLWPRNAGRLRSCRIKYHSCKGRKTKHLILPQEEVWKAPFGKKCNRASTSNTKKCTQMMDTTVIYAPSYPNQRRRRFLSGHITYHLYSMPRNTLPMRSTNSTILQRCYCIS